MTRLPKLLAAALSGLLTLAACSGPQLLNGVNALTPGDGGVIRSARGAAYGLEARQRLDVWRPKRAGAEPGPVVIFFYGGSWAMGKRQDYEFAARAYAAQGFVVVVPDYRLVPDVHFPAFVEDGAAAVRWTRDNIAAHGGDPGRISLAGHSAGAHIAALLALDRRWLTAAGVDPDIIRAGALLAGPYDFLPLTNPRAIAALGRAPDPKATQPISFVRADAPPLWLATGSEDRVVRPHNSQALAMALEGAGADPTYREYPGASHIDLIMALSKTFRGKAPVLAESSAFLIEHSAPR